ncbi:MAG: Xaa-Pro peptidase family protein [Planctomycetota bacterium]|nr:Xaa-Pro peptidase family protein [Planctomycetota bacterium]
MIHSPTTGLRTRRGGPLTSRPRRLRPRAPWIPLCGFLALACLAPEGPECGPGAVADPNLVLPGTPGLADPATAAACGKRRRALARAVGDGLLLFASGAEPERGRYLADDDFHYLVGPCGQDCLLLLEARAGELVEERLYLPAHDAQFERWNGPRLAPGPAAAELIGIASTRELSQLAPDLEELLGKPGAEGRGGTLAYAVGDAAALLEEHGYSVQSPRKFLNPLQAVKGEAELNALRAAVDITCASLADAFAVALPGAFEYTAEAAIEGGFRRRGAAALAFPSICGSGPATCILHYRKNDRRLADGDLLVMDVGAKYLHYCADVTRTIPVNGRFTARQREIYDLVWQAQQKAAAALKPGITLRTVDRVARDYLKEAGYGQAFLHGVGHHLGLRVHDVPGFRGPFKLGMVVTLEPGIYLKDEALGVRIEDDYLITEDGAELLSGAIPSRSDLLEAYLARIRGKSDSPPAPKKSKE